MIWLSTDNPQRQPQLMRIDLASGKITRIPTPPKLNTSDPHVVGEQIVFPVVASELDVLWVMNLDGTNSRQLTYPKFSSDLPRSKFAPGDYDPKLSPDGREVAFMRLFGEEGWRIFVVDTATGHERDLSGPTRIDALPDWSSNGKLLLFWHVNKENMAASGLYTMRPDSSAWFQFRAAICMAIPVFSLTADRAWMRASFTKRCANRSCLRLPSGNITRIDPLRNQY